jgi:hypothetical protein
MDRKEFLKYSLKAGMCGCAALAGLHRSGAVAEGGSAQPDEPADLTGWIKEFGQRMVNGSGTPEWLRARKARRWITDMVDHIDDTLDDSTKAQILQGCGRACFGRAFGVAPAGGVTSEQAASFLEQLRQSGNEVIEADEKTVINFHWGRDHQNPQGLILSDGYCMCMIMESDAPGLSATFCQCSVGYVTEAMERGLGKKVKVELLESLKMGGTDCRFRVDVSS